MKHIFNMTGWQNGDAVSSQGEPRRFDSGPSLPFSGPVGWFLGSTPKLRRLGFDSRQVHTFYFQITFKVTLSYTNSVHNSNTIDGFINERLKLNPAF